MSEAEMVTIQQNSGAGPGPIDPRISEDGPGSEHDASGEATKEEETRKHMAEIGRKGGLSRKQQLGLNGYKDLGRKGGEIVSRNREHMAEIGRRGGLARKSHRNRG